MALSPYLAAWQKDSTNKGGSQIRRASPLFPCAGMMTINVDCRFRMPFKVARQKSVLRKHIVFGEMRQEFVKLCVN
jgi:hypothetical protein